MRFTPIGQLDLTYVAIDFVDYGVGGQYYGVMEGELRTDSLRGHMKLTNIAQKRSDHVNTPTLRGVVEAEDGARVFVEMNGLSQIQEGGRVFIASMTFRTSESRYEALNTLFAVVEGELHGRPRANEMHARCRVYACEATIKPSTPGGSGPPVVIGYAVPAGPGHDAEVGAPGGESERRGLTRATAFRQGTPSGDLVVVYRETEGSLPADPAIRTELLIRQRPVRPGSLYLETLPLPAGRGAQFHEFAMDLNGIHTAEFEESLRRLGIGLTVFLQHAVDGDLIVLAVEGEAPEAWLARLGESSDAFDRWFMQQLASLSGGDVSARRPGVNEKLWSWERAAARVGEG